MSSPRTPLSQISGNNSPRIEHSSYTRGQIIGMRDGGQKWKAISRYLRVPISTCQRIYSRKDTNPDGLSQHRIGRPKTYSERDKRHIVRLVRIEPYITYKTTKTSDRIDSLNSNLSSYSRCL
jgi:hypothetical protein